MHFKGLRSKKSRLKLSCILMMSLLLFCSCNSSEDWEKPSWLGESIYDELQSRGNFTVYLKLADDLGLSDFLKKTGSVTVFVANDDAYRAYFAQHGLNEDALSPAMKKHFFNASMLDNAYVLDMMTNLPGSDGVSKGQVMRRTNTRWTVYDSIPAVPATLLPQAGPSHDWWSGLRDRGQVVYNLIDDGTQPMVHFIWRQMTTKNISKSDFAYLFGGKTFDDDDIYINNVKVTEPNIVCQNGYINVMESVPEVLPNMASYLKSNGSTSIFSSLLDRFSAPFSASDIASAYKSLETQYAGQNLYGPLAGGDSVYERRFFWQDANGNGLMTFNGDPVEATLKFDPAQHDYVETGVDVGTDMGAIFAPTDEAMVNYWNSDDGAFLRTRYPGNPFENVPDNVLVELINNHLQYSFLNSLPSHFSSVLDDAKDPIGLNASDIKTGASAVCDNGAVYVMNKVYAPAAFRSVMAPTLVDDNMRVMRWAIQNLEFRPYLLSMVSYYNYFILNDNAMSCYIDPVSYGSNDPRWFKFYYDEKSKTVQAYSYQYDRTRQGLDGCTEEDMRQLNSSANGDGTYQVNAVVENRLRDLLNFCIVPRDIHGTNVVNGSSEYLLTKGDGAIRLKGEGTSTQVQDQFTGNYVPVKEYVRKDNGNYYVLDKMVEPTFQTLLDVLSSNPDYSEFLELLLGNGEWTTSEQNVYAILKRSGSSFTLNDDNSTVKSFNSFQYTVYVPTNAAMDKAFAHGLPRWSDINQLDEKYAGTDVDVVALKKDYTQKVINFLKFYFQDYAVFIGGDDKSGTYETAALHLSGEKSGMSYTLKVDNSTDGITLTGNYVPSWAGSAKVITRSAQDYNQMVREYSLSAKNATGNINTSSWAVVHAIDEPLFYDEECLVLSK
ncbi:MAG: hypothetical protein I3J02_07570 [Prevotella sp.]|nr:hypothetical protein [Prevotella sp.]